MEFTFSNLVFASIILLIGILTINSDLQSQRIYNNHLIIGGILGTLALVYTALCLNENIALHILNALIAFIIGFLLHRFNLWKGGDAKLFTLYALLMPTLNQDYPSNSSVINLFVCSFIAGTLILIPLLIIDTLVHYKTVIQDLMSSEKRKGTVISFKITIFCMWVIFPFYSLIKATHLPNFSLMLTFITFNLAHRFLRKNIKISNVIALGGFLFGLLLRLWINPHSLAWPILINSIFKIGLLSMLSACIFTTLHHLSKYKDRIPFAPLLLTGCVLSYTPFLTWIMHLVRR